MPGEKTKMISSAQTSSGTAREKIHAARVSMKTSVPTAFRSPSTIERAPAMTVSSMPIVAKPVASTLIASVRTARSERTRHRSRSR